MTHLNSIDLVRKLRELLPKLLETSKSLFDLLRSGVDVALHALCAPYQSSREACGSSPRTEFELCGLRVLLPQFERRRVFLQGGLLFAHVGLSFV